MKVIVLSLAAVLSASALAFDDMTAAIRAAGAATVTLSNGTPYSASYPKENAFNGDTTPQKTTGRVLISEAPSVEKPIIIQYDISDGYEGRTTMSAFRLIIASDDYGCPRAPKYYSLEGSMSKDGPWTTLVDIDATAAAKLTPWSNTAPLVQDRLHAIPEEKQAPYRHYRFVCTENNGSTDPVHYSFTELIFYCASQFRIPSGDVVALTNAVRRLSGLSDAERVGASILLEPGLYDLTSVPISDVTYLPFTKPVRNGSLVGLGEGPGETILKGGGEAGGRRVVNLDGGSGGEGFFTVSNLTVTGGYLPGDWVTGGGINGAGTVVYRNLIVTNNYSGYAGGGCFEGRMFDCLVANNRSGTLSAGFHTKGKCGNYSMDEVRQGAWNCVFSNNLSMATSNSGGAGLVLNGYCVGCQFVGNSAAYGAALIVRDVKDEPFQRAEVRDCTFVGNGSALTQEGSAVECSMSKTCSISNCTFTANGGGASADGVIYHCDLFDCTITNNVLAKPILHDCSLFRCLVAHNASTGSLNSAVLDAQSAVSCTNVNCVFEGNRTAARFISSNKRILNCTYVANACVGSYGGIVWGCTLWNTILAQNTIHGAAWDVRYDYGTDTRALAMTNCVFTASDTTVDQPGLKDCKLVSSVRFRPSDDGGAYDIAGGSPARDAACVEDWMLPLLGPVDFAGRPRFMFNGLDVGALECQKIDGLILLFR